MSGGSVTNKTRLVIRTHFKITVQKIFQDNTTPIFKLSTSDAPTATKIILFENLLIALKCLTMNKTSTLLHLQYTAYLDESIFANVLVISKLFNC